MNKQVFSITFLIIWIILSMCEKMDKRNEQKTDLTKKQKDFVENVTYTPSHVNGNVAWSENDSKWNPLSTDMNLEQGTFVETGKHSDTRLVGSIGDVVIISERAKIQLITSELLKRKRSASLAVRGIQMLYGMAKFEVKKNIGQFTVETPSVKVNVKGTTFTVKVDSSTGKTVVAVIEGAVDVIPFNDTSEVYQLSPGDVLRNNVDGNINKDTITETDTLITGSVSIPKDSAVTESVKNSRSQKYPNDKSSIRKKLTPDPGYHSAATEQAGIEADVSIEKERQETAEKIEKEITDYQEKKQEIETNHEKMKAEAETVPVIEREQSNTRLREEKASSNSNLNKARSESKQKFLNEKRSLKEKLSNSSSNKSDNAFDELRKKREGQ